MGLAVGAAGLPALGFDHNLPHLNLSDSCKSAFHCKISWSNDQFFAEKKLIQLIHLRTCHVNRARGTDGETSYGRPSQC